MRMPEGLVFFWVLLRPVWFILCCMEEAESFLISAQIGCKTGNLKAVMDAMGHSDVRIAMMNQHPELEIVRTAIN